MNRDLLAEDALPGWNARRLAVGADEGK